MRLQREYKKYALRSSLMFQQWTQIKLLHNILRM